VIAHPVDVRFEVLWRHAGTDTLLAEATQHFEPLGGSFDATPFEATVAGPRAEAARGDLLVWRMSATGTDQEISYIVNGDGAGANGRIPFLELP
jgi:hypothetical protein